MSHPHVTVPFTGAIRLVQELQKRVDGQFLFITDYRVFQ
jgi:hypothetical protein